MKLNTLLEQLTNRQLILFAHDVVDTADDLLGIKFEVEGFNSIRISLSYSLPIKINNELLNVKHDSALITSLSSTADGHIHMIRNGSPDVIIADFPAPDTAIDALCSAVFVKILSSIKMSVEDYIFDHDLEYITPSTSLKELKDGVYDAPFTTISTLTHIYSLDGLKKLLGYIKAKTPLSSVAYKGVAVPENVKNNAIATHMFRNVTVIVGPAT